MSDNHSAQRGLRRPWGAALLLAGLCAGCNDPNTQAPPQPESVRVQSPAEQAQAKDDAYVDRYQQAKQRIAELDVTNPMAVKGAVNQLAPDLREIADKAKDSHLRANASLLLGSLYQSAGDDRSAIAFYRQAHGLLPDEIEPVRVLALALGRDGQFKEAAALQAKVVEDDMDDLEAWLLLGELHLKGGDEEEAKKAYIRYEIRRKGLLDGLTLRADGEFVTSAKDRAVCAGALAPAADNGTAMALLYALKFEPDPKVRAAILETMGIQRLVGYKQAITERLAIEDDPAVQEVGKWALDEIERDPLDSRPGVAPEVAAEAAAEGDAAAGDAKAATSGEGGEPPDAPPSPP
ncbi:MAG: hypothetical protein R3A79_09660 [Nannocystaceae bacterium]